MMLKITSHCNLQECQEENQQHYSFFESSASLETELLLSSEMKDTQGTCGSYDMTALSNHSGFSSSI